MSEKTNRITSNFCASCATDLQPEKKKRRFPKLCIGHVAMFIAFVYIALSQILA